MQQMRKTFKKTFSTASINYFLEITYKIEKGFFE